MDSSAYILSLADRCVKCGLCLPQCPTYNLAANENESPRGRIALIQGWLTGQLLPTKTLTHHLDQCLLCRRCERVCPSQVPYGEIIDESKALLVKNTQGTFSISSFVSNNSLKLMLNKTSSSLLFSALRLVQKSGVFYFAKKSGLLKAMGLQRLSTYLPQLEKPIKTKSFYPAKTSEKGNVALFTGCLSKQLDPKMVAASIRLLNHLGYGVYVPEQQVCCGALHVHDGDKQQADKLANENIRCFSAFEDVATIVSLVNGCTSQLHEYASLTNGDRFTPKVKDIIEFLAESEWPTEMVFNSFNEAVAVQIPCSLQNVLRAEDKLLALLQRIPNIKLPQEAIYNQCCGAAGSYFLRFPEISDQLKNKAIDKLLEHAQAKIIISSNLGCALQLKAGLVQRDTDIQVIHPVLFLDQQLRTP